MSNYDNFYDEEFSRMMGFDSNTYDLDDTFPEEETVIHNSGRMFVSVTDEESVEVQERYINDFDMSDLSDENYGGRGHVYDFDMSELLIDGDSAIPCVDVNDSSDSSCSLDLSKAGPLDVEDDTSSFDGYSCDELLDSDGDKFDRFVGQPLTSESIPSNISNGDGSCSGSVSGDDFDDFIRKEQEDVSVCDNNFELDSIGDVLGYFGFDDYYFISDPSYDYVSVVLSEAVSRLGGVVVKNVMDEFGYLSILPNACRKKIDINYNYVFKMSCLGIKLCIYMRDNILVVDDVSYDGDYVSVMDVQCGSKVPGLYYPFLKQLPLFVKDGLLRCRMCAREEWMEIRRDILEDQLDALGPIFVDSVDNNDDQALVVH